MFKFYSYEVFGVLDNDIIKFCKKNNIGCSDNGKICCFVGEKKDLEKLHDEFFNEYEFNIEEKTLKEIKKFKKDVEKYLQSIKNTI